MLWKREIAEKSFLAGTEKTLNAVNAIKTVEAWPLKPLYPLNPLKLYQIDLDCDKNHTKLMTI